MNITKDIYLDLINQFDLEVKNQGEKVTSIFPWFPNGYTLLDHKNRYRLREYEIKVFFNCEECPEGWKSTSTVFFVFWLYMRPRGRENVIYEAFLLRQKCERC